MASRPFHVVLVSEDRAFLRQVGRFLNACGHDVSPHADLPQASAGWRSGQGDILILDGDPSDRNVLTLLRQASEGSPGSQRCYTLLFSQRQSTNNLHAALEAGVDDFLAKPLVYAELLARLRAGVRELEFARRLRSQTGVDATTGLPTRSAFEGRLKSKLDAADAKTIPLGCVLLEFDGFADIQKLRGQLGVDELLQCITSSLTQFSQPPEFAASFGSGTFGFLQSGQSESQAAAWAESLRQYLCVEELVVGQSPLQIACSLGVAAASPGGEKPHATAEELLQHATEALQRAKSSGGNIVVRFTEAQADYPAAADFAVPGKLWQGTVARDVMTPSPRALCATDSALRAGEFLRRSRLDALPVVDGDGKLVGLAMDNHIQNGPDEGSALKVGDVMLKDVASYEDDTSFAVLREFFRHDPRSHVVITRNRRPVGIVTPNGLAALGSILTNESFQTNLAPSPLRPYLVVPDLCPVESDPA